MRNAENNHDPRSWNDRPSPAGHRRGRRPGCHQRSECSARSGRFTRRATTGSCRRGAAAAPAFRPDGRYSHQLSAFSFQPSAFRSQSFAFRVPPTVPGPAGLVSTILTAAQEHFAEASYAVANAFLKLVPQPEAHPATTWQQLGHLHFSLAEYEAAGRAYGYAAAYFPRDAAIQVRLAHTCLHLDDLASFEGYLRRALVLDPESAPALQLLADLNRDEGRHADAIGYYDRLLQAAPNHYENLLSLALCHSYLGESDTAMDYLQRAGQLVRGNLSQTTT